MKRIFNETGKKNHRTHAVFVIPNLTAVVTKLQLSMQDILTYYVYQCDVLKSNNASYSTARKNLHVPKPTTVVILYIDSRNLRL